MPTATAIAARARTPTTTPKIAPTGDPLPFGSTYVPFDEGATELEDELAEAVGRVQLPPDRVYPELHPSQDPYDEQSLQLLLYPLQQRLPCTKQSERGTYNTARKRHEC